MFGLFKAKKKTGQPIIAPVTGILMPLDDVTDDVFSQKMMGDGFAIQPEESQIVSPVSGTVSTVFPTKHAIGITTPEGLDVLVHMGLDTVELDGKPFKVDVALNDAVTAGQPLATIDREQIKKSGYDDTIVVIYTNMEKLKNFPTVVSSQITQGQQIGELIYV
ncbi:PTS sugar transporter subunit IIA [Lacticaseibacillus paracasei]|uniref:PTS system IIA component, Glc family n=1 Tax=Lacticaseibacillus paracasei (strain ATCC 334 / BCRC 17002 / CCUG 31169 / CIP 107868 / KCTC 3260 / NRRL B-441) TaxID=321967 RepID=Q03C40_LACP3|nr:PTS glucose transporter subunit IIA [Lacticaseibacillus paracasei]ABJ69232.1 PTS system IIA component, Glc family [Lacticaseibacillus paracasei ATCC 334]KRK15436.1 phosphotransferase system IIA component [Lacticaseibacillus casei DSM 20011 = JCM 1134 = ATCC 393]OSY80760.1 PTS glucose transporter subunit IIABC [Lacticaseibacillus paracasei]